MSVSIVINHDPAGINRREIITVDASGTLLDWLIKIYGDNGFSVPTTISVNGCQIDQNDYDSLNRPLFDGDIVNIIHRPQDPVTVALTVGAVIVSFLLVPDISPPPVPETPNFAKTNESPNNRLTGQTNLARPLGRIPDIYGRMRVWPDLGTRTVTEYIDNVKFVTEYLIIGRGDYQVEKIKSGETLIDDIVGSSYTIYGPNSTIPELIDITDSNEVNGQEVKAPNDAGFSTVARDISFGNTSFGASTMVSSNSGMAAFSDLEPGDKFTVTGTTSNDGTYTFKTLQTITLPAEPPDFEGGTQYAVEVEETFTAETVNTDVTFQEAGAPNIIGPFVVPRETEEVWFDLEAPRGLADRRSGTSVAVSVSLDLILEEIDSFGNVINTEKTRVVLSGNSLEQKFYTYKVTPANPGAKYQAKVERISSTVNDAAYYDTVKWTRLGGVKRIQNFAQGNVTSVVLKTKATEQAVKAQERKFNAVVTRKLRTYNTSTGQIDPTLQPTARFADALLQHLTDPEIGNKPESDIDLDGLYSIQEALDNDPIYGDALGRFSYSFSGEKTSVKDEILTIANACRVFIIKNGNRLEFARDQTRAARTSLFNVRNKKPGSESKTITLQKPSDNDGVELQWVWEDTGEAFTITLPETGTVINPKKIEAAGIRNFKQAWNRAQIEFAKIKLQRETVKFDATKDALLLRPGDRIANADGTDVEAQSGEIKAISGLNVETYSAIDFKGNASATVILRDESGMASGEITVTPRNDGINGFVLASLPSFPIRVRGDLGYQVGTLYTLALPTEQRIRDYVLQKITPRRDGYVTIEATNYNAAIYAADSQTPPAHETTQIVSVLDAIPNRRSIPDPTSKLSAAAAETVTWNTAPTGTYNASSVNDFASKTFSVDDAGGWAVTGYGTTTNDTDSGRYRASTTQDPDNYEIKIDIANQSGLGGVSATGGLTFGVWGDLTGVQGVQVTDSGSGTTSVDITVEIREKANTANTTGPATFTFSVDGSLTV